MLQPLRYPSATQAGITVEQASPQRSESPRSNRFAHLEVDTCFSEDESDAAQEGNIPIGSEPLPLNPADLVSAADIILKDDDLGNHIELSLYVYVSYMHFPSILFTKIL